MTTTSPPHEIRLGRIKATIWTNETDNGPRHNVTFYRLYKDKEETEWRTSESFGRDDLLLLGKVADMAHTWIYEQTTYNDWRQRQQEEPASEPPDDL